MTRLQQIVTYAHEWKCRRKNEDGNIEKTYGNIENCKMGVFQNKCEDDKWKCVQPGFTLSNDHVQPEPCGYGFSLCIVITLLLTPIIFCWFKLEKIDMNLIKGTY